MDIIYLLPSKLVITALWAAIWFRTFTEAGYAKPGWLTVLMIVPITAIPTLVWFLLREKPIQLHRRATRVAAETATPDDVERMLGYAIALEVRSDVSRALEINDQIGKGWPNATRRVEAIRREPVLCPHTELENLDLT